MEHQAKDNTTVSKTSPSQRFKILLHSTTDTPGLNDNKQRVVAKSDSSKSLYVSISTLEITLTQQPLDFYNKV